VRKKAADIFIVSGMMKTGRDRPLMQFCLPPTAGGETSAKFLSAGLYAFLLIWMPRRAACSAEEMSMTFLHIISPADRPSIAVVYKNTAADRFSM
jgi:hypothetical protein